MITLTQKNSNNNCGVTVGCSGRSLTTLATGANDCDTDSIAGSSNTVIGILSGETNVVGYTISSGAINYTSWESGTYTVRLNIVNTSTVITLEEIYICRADKDCISQATVGSTTGLAEDLSTTGTRTFNITGSSQTAELTDRLAFIFVFSAGAPGGALGIKPDQDIDTPIIDSRRIARETYGKTTAQILELDLDFCGNTYSISPCTASGASGTECYNCFETCQDKPNFTRTTKTYRFGNRGSIMPQGEIIRPYISSIKTAPLKIDPDKGTAARSKAIVKLVDDNTLDVNEDPYYSTRPTPASGAYWGRFIARNPNYAGRWARIRKGYPVDPWDWDTFQDELYIIESIKGPATDGSVSIILKDPLKFADRRQIPTPTSGKLTHDFNTTEDTGTAQSGTSTTIKLRNEASAVDDFYNGMNVYITGGTGKDQERTITDYVGATRVATVATWDVTVDSTSTYDVERISITLDDASEYSDPATTGNQEYISIGKEVIEYESLSGNVISWTTVLKRGQFGTSRESHKEDYNVQQCFVPINQPVTTVLTDLINAVDVADDYIDLTGMSIEETNWLGPQYYITTCIPKPVKASELIEELCLHTNSVLWWSPISQKFKYKVIGPSAPGDRIIPSFTDDNMVKVTVNRRDEKRFTRSFMYYDMDSVTEDHKKPFNFLRAIAYIDTDAESVNEYNEVRQDTNNSRFLTDVNDVAVNSWLNRRIAYRRDTQSEVKITIDPYSFNFDVADLFDFNSNTLVDEAGENKTVRVLVTSINDMGGQIEIEGLTTIFGNRYGFIAANGYPDHGLATEIQKQYAFISNASGLMGDGTDGYLII